MKLLLVTPAPKATESLLGYVLRISERNGYDTPWHVLSFAGFNQREMRTAGFPIQKLASVLGRSTAELGPLSYRDQDGSNSFKLLEQRLGGSQTYRPLRLSKPAFCPKCVEELGFIDAFWDLSAAIACPVHRQKLLEYCVVCANPIRWFRPGLLQCKCGADFRHVPLELADPAVIDMMQIIFSKLHGHKQAPRIISQLPVDALWGLPLRSLLDLLGVLGHYSISCETSNKLFRSCIVSSAVTVLDNWPLNFHALLQKLDKPQVDSKVALTLRKRYEPFYKAMFMSRKSSGDFSFLKEEFIRFGATKWGEGVVDPRMAGSTGIKQRFMSKAQLAKLVGVDRNTLSAWARQGKILLKPLPIGAQTRYIADAELLQLSTTLEGETFDQRAAAKFLELPANVLPYLKTSGHYVARNMPIFKHGYHQADLIAFQQALCSKSALIEFGALDDDTLSLKYIMQKVKFFSESGNGAFIVAYLEGDISSLGRTGEGIDTIYFRKTDVEAFVSLFRMRTSKDDISFQHTAEVIGCTLQAVKALIGKKYLDSRSVQTRLRVTRESVMRFTEKYTCLLGMAREHHTTVSRLKRLCDQSDLSVLSVEDKSGYPSFYVDNEVCAQLENLMIFAKNKISAVKSLRRYLANIRESGILLPRRAGAPNLTAIAAACNFERSIFYKNLEAQSILEKFSRDEARRYRIRLRCRPVDALKAYLADLKVTNTPLPRRGARPNMRAIAAGCGFKRDLLYSSSEMRALIEAYNCG